MMKLNFKLKTKKEKYEKPKLIKFTIIKKTLKIFNGCWQVANDQDAC